MVGGLDIQLSSGIEGGGGIPKLRVGEDTTLSTSPCLLTSPHLLLPRITIVIIFSFVIFTNIVYIYIHTTKQT